MIRKELLKYLEDEVLLLSTDKVENQVKHVKNLQTALELLITIHKETSVIQPKNQPIKETVKQN